MHATQLLFRPLCLLGLLTVLLILPNPALARPLKVLVSTFPVWQLTRNLTQGSTALDLDLLLPANLGCPHDYALTPQDMRKLAEADALLVNGLGMEEFLGAPLAQANPKITLIDSSAGIADLLPLDSADNHDQSHAHKGHRYPRIHQHRGHHHHHAHQHKGHQHQVFNPHLFASPRMAALQANTIARELVKLAPAEKELILRNASALAARLQALAEECAATGKRLKNPRIVTQHGVFDYLARDMGLHIVAVIAAHPGQEPSAAEVLRLVERMRQEQAAAVFTEPQYPGGLAATLAKEAGIPLAELDPLASGPENAPLDLYESTMRKNLKTLSEILGSK